MRPRSRAGRRRERDRPRRRTDRRSRSRRDDGVRLHLNVPSSSARRCASGVGTLLTVTIAYLWRGDFVNGEVNALHAECFDHRVRSDDWATQVETHSIGWVCARDGGHAGGIRERSLGWRCPRLRHRHHGCRGQQGASVSARRSSRSATAEARAAGCEWLHVDFDDPLQSFYFESCGFAPTNAGLIALS